MLRKWALQGCSKLFLSQKKIQPVEIVMDESLWEGAKKINLHPFSLSLCKHGRVLYVFVCVYLNSPAAFKCLHLGRVSERGKASPFIDVCAGGEKKRKGQLLGCLTWLKDKGLKKRGENTFILQHLFSATDWMCHPQTRVIKPKDSGHGIWRWGLWEVIRSCH